MTDLHTQIQTLRSQAEAREREAIKLSAQAEEAEKSKAEAFDRLKELGAESPDDARAKAEAIEAEVQAEVKRLTEVLN